MPQLLTDIIEFFGEVECQDVWGPVDWFQINLEAHLRRLAAGREWSIYSPDVGYFPFNK